MTDRFRAGAVWSGGFDFSDGEGVRKKYFVLLHDCVADGELVLVVYTTSRGEKRYGAAASSGSPCGSPTAPYFRVDRGAETCFVVPTWIQFDNRREITPANMFELDRQGLAVFERRLEEERVRSLLACARKSIDLPTRDIQRIDRTLKLLVEEAKAKAKAAVAPKVIASAEIIAVRVRVARLCATCRPQFTDLLRIADLDAIFIGTKEPPPGFAADAHAGLDYFEEACTCLKK